MSNTRDEVAERCAPPARVAVGLVEDAVDVLVGGVMRLDASRLSALASGRARHDRVSARNEPVVVPVVPRDPLAPDRVTVFPERERFDSDRTEVVWDNAVA